MSINETNTTDVTSLLALGDAGADACADGFCAVPQAQPEDTGPETFLQALETAYANETAPPRTGAASR